MTATRSELQAWLDAYDTPDGPDAQTLADFLGIELAPEPATPVGQRLRSPSGVEVVKTDNGFTEPWRKYRGRNPGPTWFADVEVEDWQIIINDAPEVPEDIIEAVILTLRADDREQLEHGLANYRTNAKALVRAGLLVGTTPDAPECNREHLPEGYMSMR